MINVYFFRRDNGGITPRVPDEVLDCQCNIIDMSKSITPVLIPISANIITSLIHIEASVDKSDEDLITVADQFNKISAVSVRFSWGPMVYRDKDQGFGHNAITEAKNKMREIINELIYPDPNTA